MRSIITFAVAIAVQVLAGCEMPAKTGLAHQDSFAWRKAEFEAREARLRRQVEAGTLGLAQLFPGAVPIDPRNLPPLPRPTAVAMPVIPEREARSSASGTPLRLAFNARSDGCVFKPVMSDAEIEACR